MAQATHETSTSRRSLLAGGAAAVALPASAVPLSAMADNADAELLALGRELRWLIPIEAAAAKEQRRLFELTDEMVGNGRPVTFGPGYIDPLEWLHTGRKIGYEAAAYRWNQISTPLYSLTDTIAQVRATTIDGLAVKALAVAWRLHHTSIDEVEDLTWALLASTLPLAGQTLPAHFREAENAA
jgi:hypothetical protein